MASPPCRSSPGTQFALGKQPHKEPQGPPELNRLKDICCFVIAWIIIEVIFNPHGMSNKGEASPRHLCDNCSDSCKMLHVVIMEACKRSTTLFSGSYQEEDEQNGHGRAGQEPPSELMGLAGAPPGLESLLIGGTLSQLPALSSQPWRRRQWGPGCKI